MITSGVFEQTSGNNLRFPDGLEKTKEKSRKMAVVVSVVILIKLELLGRRASGNACGDMLVVLRWEDLPTMSGTWLEY